MMSSIRINIYYFLRFIYGKIVISVIHSVQSVVCCFTLSQQTQQTTNNRQQTTDNNKTILQYHTLTYQGDERGRACSSPPCREENPTISSGKCSCGVAVLIMKPQRKRKKMATKREIKMGGLSCQPMLPHWTLMRKRSPIPTTNDVENETPKMIEFWTFSRFLFLLVFFNKFLSLTPKRQKYFPSET